MGKKRLKSTTEAEAKSQNVLQSTYRYREETTKRKADVFMLVNIEATKVNKGQQKSTFGQQKFNVWSTKFQRFANKNSALDQQALQYSKAATHRVGCRYW